MSTVFDQVIVTNNGKGLAPAFAKVIATIQMTFRTSSFNEFKNLLGPDTAKHFEARDIALAKLEEMTSKLLVEMEDNRKSREQEFQAKERELNDQIEKRRSELEDQAKTRQEQIDKQAAGLEELRAKLDDREAKHARRKHYDDIKKKFTSWSDEFSVTKGTSRLRITVYVVTVLLMLLFGGVAAWFLIQSVAEKDTARFIVTVR